MRAIHCGSARILFSSRLIVGTGKYASYEADGPGPGHLGHRVHHRGRPPRAADRRGGARICSISSTPAATRSCRTRPAALRPTTPSAWPGWAAKSSRNSNNPGADWVKLEVLGDKRTLLPDPMATLQATETTGGRRLSGAGLHQRRSGGGQAAEGGRGHQRHARRQPDRLRPGRAESQRHPHLPGIPQGRRSRTIR